MRFSTNSQYKESLTTNIPNIVDKSSFCSGFTCLASVFHTGSQSSWTARTRLHKSVILSDLLHKCFSFYLRVFNCIKKVLSAILLMIHGTSLIICSFFCISILFNSDNSTNSMKIWRFKNQLWKFLSWLWPLLKSISISEFMKALVSWFKWSLLVYNKLFHFWPSFSCGYSSLLCYTEFYILVLQMENTKK